MSIKRQQTVSNVTVVEKLDISQGTAKRKKQLSVIIAIKKVIYHETVKNLVDKMEKGKDEHTHGS